MRFQLYQKRSLTRGWQWRWRLRAANGKIVADSAEGYFNRADAEDGIRLVQSTGPATRIEVIERPRRGPKLRSLPR